jgi:hypothetical protein
MSFLPGWNSIENTDFWNTFYFWFGIVCLVLLAISEVVSHYYGQRHSSLVSAAERAAIERRDKQNKQTDERHAKEVTQLREQLAKIQDRRLFTPEEKKEITAALSPFLKQPVRITSNPSDTESDDFAKDFYDIVIRAGWDYKGTPGKFETFFGGGSPVGVEVTVNEEDARRGRGPLAYNSLMAVLHKLGVVNPYAPAFINPNVTQV